MRVSYLAFFVIVALAKVAEFLLVYWYQSSPSKLPQTLNAPKPISVAEQLFALGKKIPLSYADMYDLELIPGVSDLLAQNILEAREKIIGAAQASRNPKLSPFELAHGVGKKTARKLERYLIAE